VNRSAGRLSFQLRRHAEAIGFYEKAAALMETDMNSLMMLISCHTAIGDADGKMRAAQLALKRADAMLASDPNNIAITVYSVYALAALGERERAKARMDRALLIDPDNFNLSYNFACAMCVHLQDAEAALGMLKPVFEKITETFLPYAKADPDFDLLRDDPRYQAMVDAAEARLAEAQGGTESSQAG
jgi:adenylate cyclase